MKLPKLISICIVVLSLSACKKEKKPAEPAQPDPIAPTACYTTSKHFIKIGDSISFQNCSVNYDKVEWIYGDGSTSTQVSPTHIFNDKGLHEVVLFSYNGNKTTKFSDTIVCGMKASATLTLDFSNWDIPPAYLSHVWTVVIHCALYKSSDTTKPIATIGEWYSRFNSTDKFIFTIPLQDELTKYQVKTILTGVYSVNSNSNADMYVTEEFGSMFTDEIAIYGHPKPKGSKKFKMMTLNYSTSAVSFD